MTNTMRRLNYLIKHGFLVKIAGMALMSALLLPPTVQTVQAQRPDRRVHSRGELVIRGTWKYDLDLGAQTNAGADLFWEQATNVKRYLTPLNGARFFVVGIRDFASVTPRDLERFPYSPARINGSNEPSNQIPRGTVVAYRTNEGRLGKFIVDGYGYNLRIRWVTFE